MSILTDTWSHHCITTFESEDALSNYDTTAVAMSFYDRHNKTYPGHTHTVTDTYCQRLRFASFVVNSDSNGVAIPMTF